MRDLNLKCVFWVWCMQRFNQSFTKREDCKCLVVVISESSLSCCWRPKICTNSHAQVVSSCNYIMQCLRFKNTYHLLILQYPKGIQGKILILGKEMKSKIGLMPGIFQSSTFLRDAREKNSLSNSLWIIKSLYVNIAFCGNAAKELCYGIWDICQVNMKGFIAKAMRKVPSCAKCVYSMQYSDGKNSMSIFYALFDLLSNMLCKHIFWSI